MGPAEAGQGWQAVLKLGDTACHPSPSNGMGELVFLRVKWAAHHFLWGAMPRVFD